MYLRFGSWCFRHRKLTLVLWIIGMVAAFGTLSQVGSDFGGDPEPPESESRDAFEILDENFGASFAGAGQGGTIVFRAEQGVDDPAVREAMEELFEFADSTEGVDVVSPYESVLRNQVSEDRTVAYAQVNLDEEDIGFAGAGELGDDLYERSRDIPGVRVEIGGQALAGFEPPQSETIGLAFAIVVLIVSFGSVLAMGLPVAVALAGVSMGAALSSLLSNVLVMPDFATVIGTMIGLGVGIDYALFIVTRFRENLHLGDEPLPAAASAMDTAGRAVVFAGVTVVASLLGLLLIGLPFIAGLGVAASVTVAVTMLASITLLPALLGFAQLKVEVTRWRGLIAAGLVSAALLGQGLGIEELAFGVPAAIAVLLLGSVVPGLRGLLTRTVPRREPKPLHTTGWYRWSHLIQRRPWPFAIGGTLVLLALALPVLGIRLGFSDEGNFPEESTTRQAYDLLAEGFGPGFNGPFVAVTELQGDGAMDAFRQVVQAIEADPGVAEVSPAIPNNPFTPAAAVVQIIPTTSPQDEVTEQTVERLRDEVIPEASEGAAGIDVALTGFVVVSSDFSDYLAGRSMLFFGAVLVISFLLLMAVFRSLLVPLKAVVMNMLSIAGAYGAVVAVFQWGWLSDLLPGIRPAPIEPFIPMMMFAIVFGLSMDYEVFLLSRIREEYSRTDDAQDSVANGLAATARVISAAAAIMVVVFGSFVLEDDRIAKVFGTGLALAVLLDATLVRMLLVPATMELLGRRNWWIPRWLDRILPNLNVEGSPHRTIMEETDEAATEAGEDPAEGVATPPQAPVLHEPMPVTKQDLTDAFSDLADVVDGAPRHDEWHAADLPYEDPASAPRSTDDRTGADAEQTAGTVATAVAEPADDGAGWDVSDDEVDWEISDDEWSELGVGEPTAGPADDGATISLDGNGLRRGATPPQDQWVVRLKNGPKDR